MHVDNKGKIDGLWRGERKYIDPKAGNADLWIKKWEELNLLTSKEILVKVEHVKAHRTKNDKKETSQFEKFVAEGNEKSSELARAGAMLDEGFMTQARAKTSQEREEVRAACTAWWRNEKIVKSSSRSQKEKWIFVDKKRDDTKHRTEWCADANKYRCMRCG